MNVNEIVNIIKGTAHAQRGVNSFYDGDVYENWNSAEVKYGSVNVGIQNITYNSNLVTYSLIFYYGDRLLQDKKNVNSVYSDGVRVLQSIINHLNNIDGIDIPEEIMYTPFEQKFMDYLAGVYATVDIQCESELGLCDIDELDFERKPYLWLMYTYQNVMDGSDIQEIPSNMIDANGNLLINQFQYNGYLLTCEDVRNLETTAYDGTKWYYSGIDVDDFMGYRYFLYRISNQSVNHTVKQCLGLANEITTTPAVSTTLGYFYHEENRNAFLYKMYELDGKTICWHGRTQYITGVNDVSTTPKVYHYTEEDDMYTTPSNAIVRGHTLLQEGHYYRLTVKRFNHYFKSYNSGSGQYISGWIMCFDEVSEND